MVASVGTRFGLLRRLMNGVMRLQAQNLTSLSQRKARLVTLKVNAVGALA